MHLSGEYRWNAAPRCPMYLSDRLYTYDDLIMNFSTVRGERPSETFMPESFHDGLSV